MEHPRKLRRVSDLSGVPHILTNSIFKLRLISTNLLMMKWKKVGTTRTKMTAKQMSLTISVRAQRYFTHRSITYAITVSPDGEILDHGQEEDSNDRVPLTDAQSLVEKETQAALVLAQSFARSGATWDNILTDQSDNVESQAGSEIGPGTHQIITKVRTC